MEIQTPKETIKFFDYLELDFNIETSEGVINEFPIKLTGRFENEPDMQGWELKKGNKYSLFLILLINDKIKVKGGGEIKWNKITGLATFPIDFLGLDAIDIFKQVIEYKGKNLIHTIKKQLI